MADYIINLSGNICELLIALYFFKGRYSPRVSKSVFSLLCIVFTLFQFLNTNLFLAKSPLVSFCSLIFVFLISLLYDMKWGHRLIFTVVVVIVNTLSEMFIGMMLTLVLQVDVLYLQNTPVLFSVCTLLSKFLAYIVVLVTKKRDFNIENYAKVKYFYLIYSLPVASLLIMLLFLRCCYVIDDFSFQIMNLISTVVLIFANISVFYIIDKINEMAQAKEKLLFTENHIANQAIHYQELYNYQNELRVFRHDIRNRLFSLMAMVKDGQADKAVQIMENNLNWLEEMNGNIVNSGNPIIDALLQSKLHLAKEKKIKLNLQIKLAGEIKVDELELAIVLGNALDNAIEAVEKVPDKDKKFINLNLMSTDDRISMTVTNPVKDDINTEKLKTTKPDKRNHGFGTQSIRTVAHRYDGVAEFKCEDKMFTVNLNICNIEDER